MDNKTQVNKEASEDVTRESLIAISYSLPDKVLASPESGNRVGGGGIDVDEADRCRSELISISYPQSPDAKKDRPVPPLGYIRG